MPECICLTFLLASFMYCGPMQFCSPKNWFDLFINLHEYRYCLRWFVVAVQSCSNSGIRLMDVLRICVYVLHYWNISVVRILWWFVLIVLRKVEMVWMNCDVVGTFLRKALSTWSLISSPVRLARWCALCSMHRCDVDWKYVNCVLSRRPVRRILG